MTHRSNVTMTDEEIYQKLREYIHGLSFGYVTTDENLLEAGADLIMLKEFITPQEALYILDMPEDDFFTVEWFAEKQEMSLEEADETLRNMALRANVYREKRADGNIWYHNVPAAHGIYEFHAGPDMNANWLGNGLFPVLQTGTLQIVYDAGIPFYRCVPLGSEVVIEGELLPEDDIFAKLKTHRRFSIAPCACLNATRDVLGVHNCDHPTGVCIQTDEMADYYIDDLGLGREATLEETEKILRDCIANDLAVQTTFAKKNEIICSCSVCHCGILPALANWPGDAAQYVTNYEVLFNRLACTKCETCVTSCPMHCITLDSDGYPEITGQCIGCGQCVRNCESDARVLTVKSFESMHPLPERIWDTYPIMEQMRREKGAL
ncbi:MAG: 4Fe-4S dicluster domain-containing protein [Raoultibacter sp.]